MSKVNIIPMAGLGSRFADNGYLLPKAVIPVSGRPMIVNAIRHMPSADRWIFLVREEHIVQFSIDQIIKDEIRDAVIIAIDKTTEGQASTCMLAMPHVKPDDSIFIAACDNAFLYDKKKYSDLIKDESVDCVVWTFTNDELLRTNPMSWGWVRLANDRKTIADMSVKIPISDSPMKDHAVVATFFFRKAQDFIDGYNLMVKEGYRINNEFYVDALPIFLNKLNKKSVIFDVDLYVGWGKPSDLYLYDFKEYQYRAKKLGSETQDVLWKRFFKLSVDNPLKRQLFRFIIAGIAAVACDFAVYYIFISFMSHAPAKAISFLSGTTLAYIINKYWTFEHAQKNLKETLLFFILYAATLLINVAVNAVAIRLFGSIIFAFLCATGTSTILNFAGQKWVVFKKRS